MPRCCRIRFSVSLTSSCFAHDMSAHNPASLDDRHWDNPTETSWEARDFIQKRRAFPAMLASSRWDPLALPLHNPRFHTALSHQLSRRRLLHAVALTARVMCFVGQGSDSELGWHYEAGSACG